MDRGSTVNANQSDEHAAPAHVRGTEGYAEEADVLFQKYESIPFADNHRAVLHLIPEAPCHVLDIGSGTGRDAAGFAAMGHHVVAVEPTAGLRTRAAALHASPLIEWLDDSLPELKHLMARGETFDVVMLTAVWMHLDAPQRKRAMPKVASLLRPGGALVLSLRHGPVPPGRRMFAVTAEETITLANAETLRLTLQRHTASDAFGRSDVSWTRLAFVRDGKGS